MVDDEDKLLNRAAHYSNIVLDYLLKKRQQTPSLNFWLRQINKNKRLDKGLWFQGNENYIFIGFYARPGGPNMTQSIGVVCSFDEKGLPQLHFELITKGEKDHRILNLYDQIKTKLGNFSNFGKEKYLITYENSSIQECLNKFLSEHKPIIDHLIDENDLNEEFIIPDNKFEKWLNRILEIKQTAKKRTMILSQEKALGPLNQILYGPPGTGKTYALSNDYFNRFTSRQSMISREEFLKKFLDDKSWWEVIALVLLETGKAKVSEIFNHELLQLKVELSNSTTVRPTIWGQLQGHTIESCEFVGVKKKTNPLIFNKTSDSYWDIVQDEVEQQIPELFDYQKQIKNFKEQPDLEIKRYEFVTFHQSFSYEDFIEGIKPAMSDEEDGVSYEIQDGLFKKIANRARKDPGQKYAIFIDEINRGNVSQIFGELITLIEDDKRDGEDNELPVLLPYSKTEFKVPPNLHIIGTMNTADRSVEALDTALRRRFAFKEIMPNPSVIEEHGASNGNIEDINLVKLLTVINERIEVLIDRDHTIGHSYFMQAQSPNDLKLVFKDKIIPLMQEYFYGDYGKIGMVLGSGFVEKIKDQVKFASFNGYNTSMYEQNERYILKPINEEFDITAAINLLLNKDAEE